MKIIQGGKQLSLIRDTEETMKFLEFLGKKAIIDENSLINRLESCRCLFSVVRDEEDNLEYLLKNLDLLVERYRIQNTVIPAELGVNVKKSLEDFRGWSTDPFGWERSIGNKDETPVAPPRKTRKASRVASGRKVSFPIRGNFCVEMTLPKDGLTTDEFKRLGLFLYPYCKDMDSSKNIWN